MIDSQMQKILERLEDCEKRIKVLEGNKIKGRSQKNSTHLGKKTKKKAEDLNPPIQKLLKEGFFREAKIDKDVVTELQKRLLTRKTPLRASVVNVLRKLVREEILERTGIIKDKKQVIAYQNSK